MTTSEQHLASLGAALAPLETETRAVVAGLSAEQLDWAPEPGQWSIAQCLEHLVVAWRCYHPVLATAIGSARERAGSSAGASAYRPTWLGARFVSSMRDTTGQRRFRAPRMFQPAARPAPGAAERLLATQQELRALIDQAAGLELTRVKLRSPVTALVRLNLGEALELQVVHIARHLAQARRVRAHAGFPAPVN
jgi:hypothetical protein